MWPIEGIKKFETLSYLPPLSVEQLLKQIEYLIRSKWVPCLEFTKVGFVYRENARSPGYYNGRYWTMWKLPMFGCTDAPRCSRNWRKSRRSIRTLLFASSVSIMSDRCNASASSPTSHPTARSHPVVLPNNPSTWGYQQDTAVALGKSQRRIIHNVSIWF